MQMKLYSGLLEKVWERIIDIAAEGYNPLNLCVRLIMPTTQTARNDGMFVRTIHRLHYLAYCGGDLPCFFVTLGYFL